MRLQSYLVTPNLELLQLTVLVSEALKCQESTQGHTVRCGLRGPLPPGRAPESSERASARLHPAPALLGLILS